MPLEKSPICRPHAISPSLIASPCVRHPTCPRNRLARSSGSLAMLAAINRASSRVRPACRHPRRLFFGRINLVVPRRQRIADDLPSQEDTSSSECISIAVAKDDDIFRHKNCYEVIAVTTKRHATSRLLAGSVVSGISYFRHRNKEPQARRHTRLGPKAASGVIGGWGHCLDHNGAPAIWVLLFENGVKVTRAAYGRGAPVRPPA